MPSMRAATAVAIIAAVPVAVAGPDWDEMNAPMEAGPLPGSAQTAIGAGTLGTIHGQLTGVLRGAPSGGGDFQDMYRVLVVDPAGFSLEILPDTDFDTQIWLFDANGMGVLANDDAFPGNPLSAMQNEATDPGPLFMLEDPGEYFIAVSGFDSDPVSGAAGPIFNQAVREEVSRPDGPGGNAPIQDWNGPVATGSYTIKLTGVAFVPPCPGDINGDGAVDSADLSIIIGRFGDLVPPLTQGDLNGDGKVDSADLSIVIGAFGDRCDDPTGG